MALDIRQTVLIPIPKIGTIKIVPHGGRKVSITAPQSLDILDSRGRPLDRRRARNLTKGRAKG